ncbi:MAG: 2Fe-2S iron-sulfur cluster binding domain-containing protein, partial [Rhodospirillaceae bacterium]|nr:2Fe-2S iron-sulfur cluster binding domain-containing protein [Rhodospirillaceae bacterium]
MSKSINFMLNEKSVTADAGESIWEVADRLGIEIPHLCHKPADSYRADGNCRACMVEIEGERTLAASCIRKPTEGMNVSTNSQRSKKSREMVLELLVADQPDRQVAHDPESTFWKFTNKTDIIESRFPPRSAPKADSSHPAIAVNMDACIQCGLCVRACREIQVNDVIGMAGR